MKKTWSNEVGHRACAGLTILLFCCMLTTKVCFADMGVPSLGGLIFLGMLGFMQLMFWLTLILSFFGFCLFVKRLITGPYGKQLRYDIGENVLILGYLVAGTVTCGFLIGFVVYYQGLRKALRFATGKIRQDDSKIDGVSLTELNQLTHKLKDSEEYFGVDPQKSDVYYRAEPSDEVPKSSAVLKALALGLFVAFVGTMIASAVLHVGISYTSEFWARILLITGLFLVCHTIFNRFNKVTSYYVQVPSPTEKKETESDRIRRRQEIMEETAIHINRRMPRDEEPKKEKPERKSW